MKKNLLSLSLALCAVLCVGKLTAQASYESPVEIEVTPGVLKMAEWAQFPYRQVLDEARTGNSGAIQKFLGFHGVVDGIDAINHGMTTLELLAAVGDETFAAACTGLKPTLKTVSLERMILGQGRTKYESLRQSMTHWAPITYNVLAGKPMAAQPGGAVQAVMPDSTRQAAPTIDNTPKPGKPGAGKNIRG